MRVMEFYKGILNSRDQIGGLRGRQGQKGKGKGLTYKNFWHWLIDYGGQSTERDEHAKVLLGLSRHLISRLDEDNYDLNHHTREFL